MNAAKKHHFLPQFYLRGFSLPDKPTHVLQIEKSEAAKRFGVNICDAAAQSHYHTTVDKDGNRDSSSLETALSKAENTFQLLLKKVQAKQPLDENDLGLLCYFVAHMDARVPASKAAIESQYIQTPKAFGKVLLKDDRLEQTFEAHAGLKFSNYPPHIRKAITNRVRKMIEADEFSYEISNNQLLRQMFEDAGDPRWLRFLGAMNITVFEASQNKRFITGDTPVSRFYPRRLRLGEFGVGLANVDIELSIPLSSTMLLRLNWAPRDFEYRTADDLEVAEFNRRTIITAQRLLFASDDNLELLQQIQINEHLRAGNETDLHHDRQNGSCMGLNRIIPVFPADCYN